MKQPAIKRYRFYLAIQVAVVLLVLLLFKALPSKSLAGSVAGGLFTIDSLLLFFLEQKTTKAWTFTKMGALAFLVLGILPIVLIRALHWGQDFSILEIMGVPAPQFHRISSYVFLAQAIAIFIDLQKAKLQVLKKTSR